MEINHIKAAGKSEAESVTGIASNRPHFLRDDAEHSTFGHLQESTSGARSARSCDVNTPTDISTLTSVGNEEKKDKEVERDIEKDEPSILDIWLSHQAENDRMRRIVWGEDNTKQLSLENQPARHLVNLGKALFFFRLLRANVQREECGHCSIPVNHKILTEVELLALIKFGWVRLSEIDWKEARHWLGHSLVQHLRSPAELLASKAWESRRRSDEETEEVIQSNPKPLLKGDLFVWNPEEDSRDREENGPFGRAPLDIVNKQTLELIYQAITRADEDGKDAKDDLRHVLERSDGLSALALLKPILERSRIPYELEIPLPPGQPHRITDINKEECKLRTIDRETIPDTPKRDGRVRGLKRVRTFESEDELGSLYSIPLPPVPLPSWRGINEAASPTPKSRAGGDATSSFEAVVRLPLSEISKEGSQSCIRALRDGKTYRTDTPLKRKRRLLQGQKDNKAPLVGISLDHPFPMPKERRERGTKMKINIFPSVKPVFVASRLPTPELSYCPTDTLAFGVATNFISGM